jgi:hypothetical protein
MLKCSQQLFDVALHVEERIRLRGDMHALGDGVAGRGKSEVPPLIVMVAELLKNFARLEQSHIRRSAIQVVADHVDEAG